MTNLESNMSSAENNQENLQAEEAQKEYNEKIKSGMKKFSSAVVGNIKDKHMMPKDALGFDNTTIEAIYSHAYRLYNAQKYSDAFSVFRTLMLLNPIEKKYLFGLAACLHRLHEYEDAVKAYLINAIFDADNPVIYFHVADCYARIGALPLAESSLENVVRLAQDKPQFEVLCERSRLMLESIRNGTFTLPKEPQETRKWGHGCDDVDTDDDDE